MTHTREGQSSSSTSATETSIRTSAHNKDITCHDRASRILRLPRVEVSDPDYNDMEYLNSLTQETVSLSQKRYATYIDPDPENPEVSPMSYTFMGEALMNIYRIYDGHGGISDFELPMPSEDTMVSVRIDTGREKVDTDYMPLGCLDMLFNQEFCL
ncbi:hypothetical protein BGZ65_010284 [Modicella reniformis]|uniref:Uncharacterized protein n=1 Tax=Modicella reniformis TaxID=1440133 RepID=A0A9P6SPM0_9FUNG|nr:hypothetical protein BGZ65_010284 [Modicella reniformis]